MIILVAAGWIYVKVISSYGATNSHGPQNASSMWSNSRNSIHSEQDNIVMSIKRHSH